MSALPVTGVFNDGYIAELFESFRRDPASVDASWRELFQLAQGLSGLDAPTSAASADPGLLRKVAGAAALAEAIRHYGHLAVHLDPLGTEPMGAAELTPAFHELDGGDLPHIPASALGAGNGTAADVITHLRAAYCSTIGFEIEHLEDDQEREWFRRTIEGGDMRRSLTPDEKKSVLQRLTEVDGLERFLGRVYQGHKRFSIEGSDVLVPMLDAAIERAGVGGTREVVISMAHRGRLNVLAHTLGKPYGWLFEEFEGKPSTEAVSESGDVKYHLGARGRRTLSGKQSVDVLLVPNPSHLEFVNPVLEGVARARQRGGNAGNDRDELSVMPVCIHGDAAFIGEGVVAESFNLSRLRGYRTGGTLHIIVNNQVGFTTDPSEARSTYYASDLAKGFDIPILHVNGDDPESCLTAVWMSVAYRERFRKDLVIDVVGYRRHGHNEGDEPAYTQPQLYATIRQHPTPRQVWGARLVREEVLTEQDVEAVDRDVTAVLEKALAAMKSGGKVPDARAAGSDIRAGSPPPSAPPTAVSEEQLIALNERIHAWPADLRVHPRLGKQLLKRKEALQSGAIEWGFAEALAFGSLLSDGVSIRLTGQDAERGTFSHRHAVLHDIEDGRTFIPLQHLDAAKGRFEVYNSPLSETACLGFEYGYSTVAPDALTLWEAQYGDFVNVAQPIIDQFIVSDRAKWGQDSGLVLLLPHGYEGGGPEHSSAKLERFLQLFGENNMVVAYPSTPAQYFHILRRQATRNPRRPLILMQPKSLLRLPEAASPLAELTSGSFRPVIDDSAASTRREDVRRLVFCTGKMYYDILAKSPGSHVAVVRVEELAPWPHDEVARVVDLYPAIEEVVWTQEEPKNMGAWTFISPRLRASTGNALTIRYVGRPERASPAEGNSSSHKREQERIVMEVLAEMKRGKRDGAGGKRESGKREAGSPI